MEDLASIHLVAKVFRRTPNTIAKWAKKFGLEIVRIKNRRHLRIAELDNLLAISRAGAYDAWPDFETLAKNAGESLLTIDEVYGSNTRHMRKDRKDGSQPIFLIKPEDEITLAVLMPAETMTNRSGISATEEPWVNRHQASKYLGYLCAETVTRISTGRLRRVPGEPFRITLESVDELLNSWVIGTHVTSESWRALIDRCPDTIAFSAASKILGSSFLRSAIDNGDLPGLCKQRIDGSNMYRFWTPSVLALKQKMSSQK